LSISELSKALIDRPTDTLLLSQRRNLYIKNQKLLLAINDQAQLFSLDSLNPKKRFHLAELYYQQAEINPNFYAKSMDLLLGNFDYPPILLLRAQLNYIYQNYDKSLEDLNQYLPNFPFDAKAYFYKGLVYKEMGDLDMAKSQFQTAVEQNSKDVDSYEQLAFIYAFQKDTLAQYYFDNAIMLDSSNINLRYNKAMYLQNINDFGGAKDVYSSILRLDTNHIDAHFNLGYIFLMTKDYESAIDHFSFVINQSRNHTSAFFSRGLSYKLIGNTDKAKADFLTTLELDSTFIEATNELKNMP
jgi:tetratricopeptide (TPR) repeat protein